MWLGRLTLDMELPSRLLPEHQANTGKTGLKDEERLTPMASPHLDLILPDMKWCEQFAFLFRSLANTPVLDTPISHYSTYNQTTTKFWKYSLCAEPLFHSHCHPPTSALLTHLKWSNSRRPQVSPRGSSEKGRTTLWPTKSMQVGPGSHSASPHLRKWEALACGCWGVGREVKWRWVTQSYS